MQGKFKIDKVSVVNKWHTDAALSATQLSSYYCIAISIMISCIFWSRLKRGLKNMFRGTLNFHSLVMWDLINSNRYHDYILHLSVL